MERREVLRNLGILAVSGILRASNLQKAAEIIISPEIPKFSSILVLDVFKTEEFKQRLLNHPQNIIDVGQMAMRFNGSNPIFDEYLKEQIQNNYEAVEIIMLKIVESNFADHGKKVVAAGIRTAQLFDRQDKTERQERTILEAVNIEKIEFDQLENPIVWLSISSKKAERLISESNSSIVNLSFEFGQFPILFNVNELDQKGKIQPKKPENISISFVDGYAGEETEKNLEDLARLAAKFPNKIFIAAGGNPSWSDNTQIPDICQAKANLRDKGLWPLNLLLIGLRKKNDEMGKLLAYGCDIYVKAEDLESLGFLTCTTYAVPVISEIVNHLSDHGIKSPGQVKAALRQMSDQKYESGPHSFNLLDLRKAVDFFKELS